ncbi:MAG TPA: type VI secretion system protein TssA [Bryobacteraceae bacterium]|jgi:type VI secretion system protein ImpA
MPTDLLVSDNILDPISPDRPAGADLRWTAEWDRIKEARRADDGLEAGHWAKKESKAADWSTVRELSAAALKERSKDLQLALWLTEANMRLDGFRGLSAGLRIVRELMVRYWDNGLYPSMEDGPEDRAGPFEWLNNKLVDAITALPITARADGEPDYSFNDLVDARRVGSEAGWRKADGEIDETKKKAYEAAVAQGRLTLDQFEAAIKATPRASYEEFSTQFDETLQEFKQLEKIVDEKFGDAAPDLSACRAAFSDIRIEVERILKKKHDQEPARAPLANPAGHGALDLDNPLTVRFPLSLPETSAAAGTIGSSWEEAQMLVRSGQVDKGLARMVQLSLKETTGRARFERRLLLAEACLASRRPRLARSILEELAEQIDKFQLESWESSEMISSVWTRLYQVYKQGDDSDDREKAAKLYARLCRLDPWQALGCGEG